MRPTKRFFKFISLLLAGVFWLTPLLAAETPIHSGTVLPQPKDIPTFNLTNQHNLNFTEKNLLGKWSLLFFGFTNCQMICPTSMAELVKMYSILKGNQLKTLPQVVFISVDPERDTTKKINQYVTSFNKNFIGVTGDKAELDKLAAALGVLYMKVEGANVAPGTSIDHSGSILLINPDAKLAAVFTMPHHSDALAKDFKQITAQ